MLYFFEEITKWIDEGLSVDIIYLDYQIAGMRGTYSCQIPYEIEINYIQHVTQTYVMLNVIKCLIIKFLSLQYKLNDTVNALCTHLMTSSMHYVLT